MPTISLTRLALLAIKILIAGVIFGIIIAFMGTFGDLLTAGLNKAFASSSTVNGVNLGYVAGAIGLDTFVNNVLSSIYIAVAFYGSAMITIIGFKYVVKMYSIGMSA